MAVRRLKPSTLGIIIMVVPASFYVGTALKNGSLTSEEPALYPPSMSTPSLPASSLPSPPAAQSVETSRQDQPSYSGANDLTILQARIKSLKTSKFALENEIKDNQEKLRRVEERTKRKEAGLSS